MVDIPDWTSESGENDGMENAKIDIPMLVQDFQKFISQDVIILHRNQDELVNEFDSLVRQYERIADDEGKELAKKVSGEKKRPEEITIFDEVSGSYENIETWCDQNQEAVEKINRLNEKSENIFDSISFPDDEGREPEIKGEKAVDIINRISKLQRLIQASE